MIQLKVGDVVRLRSGGPAMSVSLITSLDGEQICDVEWFVGDAVAKESFVEPQLELSYPTYVSAECVLDIFQRLKKAGITTDELSDICNRRP
jgi:uncharacterized protein YodC (DUF2158 family)